MSELRAYTASLYIRRSGSLESFILATPEKIQSLLGREFYASDVLGKHSEISFTWTQEDIDETFEETPIDTFVVAKMAEALAPGRDNTYILVSGFDFFDHTDGPE